MPDRDGSILAIEGVEAGYFPDVPILNGVGVSIRPREIVTIVGPNGAGKSTLVKVVIGLLPPWAGSVRLRGEDVTGKKPHAIVARGVGYVAQRDNVFATMSVEENLELGALVLRSADPEARLGEMLDLFPRLGERRRQPAGTLSGGERQMLALARALMAGPELLLLDEPSAGLSPIAVDLIFEKIAEINASGIAILMVEQNARRALAMSHRGYVLDGGQNRFEGSGARPAPRPQGRRPVPGRAGRRVGGRRSVIQHEEVSADPRLEPEEAAELRRADPVHEPDDDREIVDVVEDEDRVRQRGGLSGQEEVVVERREQPRAVACLHRAGCGRARPSPRRAPPPSPRTSRRWPRRERARDTGGRSRARGTPPAREPIRPNPAY